MQILRKVSQENQPIPSSLPGIRRRVFTAIFKYQAELQVILAKVTLSPGIFINLSQISEFFGEARDFGAVPFEQMSITNAEKVP